VEALDFVDHAQRLDEFWETLRMRSARFGSICSAPS